MTKRPDKSNTVKPPLEPVSDQAFKHLVERLLNTPPKHKSSPKPKKQKRRSQGH